MGNCLGRCLSGKSGFRYSTDELDEDLVPEESSNKSYIFKIMKFKRKKKPEFLEQFWERKDLSYTRLAQPNPPVESSDIQLQCLDAQTLLLAAREFQSTKGLNNNYTELGAASSSRASSSLDLEWEHEYSQNNQITSPWLFLADEASEMGNGEEDDHIALQKQSDAVSNKFVLVKMAPTQSTHVSKSVARTPSKSSWSHISTPESLEWDIDEEQQKQLRIEDDNLDHDTLELLHQIEILKNKVLSETGDGLEMDLFNSQS